MVRWLGLPSEQVGSFLYRTHHGYDAVTREDIHVFGFIDHTPGARDGTGRTAAPRIPRYVDSHMPPAACQSQDTRRPVGPVASQAAVSRMVNNSKAGNSYRSLRVITPAASAVFATARALQR
jgi:hypothetical protein